MDEPLLDWDDLPMTVLVQTKADAETALGETVYQWTTALTLRGLVQQHLGIRRSVEQTGGDEGLQSRHTHALYCRLTCSPTDPTPVVLADTQRVKWQDPNGVPHVARVLGASDEGGQQDHYKVLLYELKTGPLPNANTQGD